MLSSEAGSRPDEIGPELDRLSSGFVSFHSVLCDVRLLLCFMISIVFFCSSSL